MPRFEVTAAYATGVLLPLLETARRRTHFEDIPSYVDDYLVGALLLWGAWAVTSRHTYGPYLLAAAWGVLCGGMWGSFFSQLRATSDVSGLPNEIVVVVKGAVFLVALIAVSLSIARAAATPRRA